MLLSTYKESKPVEVDLNTHIGSSTGRKCDGYDSASGETSPTSMMAVVCVKEAAISGALPVRDLNPGEHRSLQFFAERTVKQMVTFFPDELWSTVVLRLAHSEPSIMHALVAFSSYHERFLCSTANQDEEAGAEFSLQQYNKAIRYRLDALQSGQSLEKEFITCLIFICIEVSKPQP